MRSNQRVTCPICGGNCFLLDVVDFNKSCEEARGKFLELSGIPIYYQFCDNCNFCFAPEIALWPFDDFEQKIYNNHYIDVDPDYIEVRPRGNALRLISMFKGHAQSIKHLDYGGGEGVLSKTLRDAGWNSDSYDPFIEKGNDIRDLGCFDLITAYEVFEHVPDVHQLMSNLRLLLAPNGIILFSTLVSDANIKKNSRLTWWYASPRNGHISLFSKKSLVHLASRYGFNSGSFSTGFHVYFTSIPNWASHIIRLNGQS